MSISEYPGHERACPFYKKMQKERGRFYCPRSMFLRIQQLLACSPTALYMHIFFLEH